VIDITRLLSNVEKIITVEKEIIYEQQYLENTDIISISPIKVSGSIFKNDIGDLDLNINVSGELVLPCSVTLEPVKYPFSFEINEIIDEKDENNLRKDENTLELKEFLWQNIVVEIPLRVVSDHAYDKEYKGNGWRLVTEEEKKETGNKSLEVLKQLLEKEEEE